MKEYHFKDVLIKNKQKTIVVMNAHQEHIGSIQMTDIEGCEQGSSFSFTTNNDQIVQMGIQKRRLKNILFPQYTIKWSRQTYTLRDKPGYNLLYFCVVGKIDDQTVTFEENWSGDIELKIDDVHHATIKINEFTLKTTILVDQTIHETSIFFAVTVLIYFMFKIYENEAEFIEGLLLDD